MITSSLFQGTFKYNSFFFIESNVVKLEKFGSSRISRSFKDGKTATKLLEKLELWYLKRQF